MNIANINSQNIITKTNVPSGGYCANPYVGCTHACKYCYACFMKRFTNHPEHWGDFLDIKYWGDYINVTKYAGETIVIGTATDPYLPQEKEHKCTRKLLEQLKDSDATITIITKSHLVLRDLDLLTQMKKPVTVAISINTLDEKFKADMDKAPSIKHRLDALRKCHEAGLQTACFISPIFPNITNIFKIIDEVKEYVDSVWLENLNLRMPYKIDILEYIAQKYEELVPLYDAIYNQGDNTYWSNLDMQLKEYAKQNNLPYLDNYLPPDLSAMQKPVLINYFYHKEVRGTLNTGRRNKKV